MKTSTQWIATFFALGAAGLSACGGGDGGTPLTEDEFCNQTAAIECGTLVSGCGFMGATLAACEAQRKQVCVQEAASLRVPGKRDFREAKAELCLAETRRSFSPIVSAADWKKLRSVCSRTFEGLAKANEACTVDLDCVSPLVCDKGVCGTTRVVAANAPCSNPGEVCPATQSCTRNATTGFFACAARAALGSACSATALCAETLRCSGGLCQERLGMGAACVSHDDCQSTLLCNPLTSTCTQSVNFAGQCTNLGGSGGTPGADAGATDAGTNG